jgi:hypothetical protein
MHRAAVLLTVALLGAACSSGDDPTLPSSGGDTSTVVEPDGGTGGGRSPVETTPDGELVIPPGSDTTVAPGVEPPDDGLRADGPPGSFAPGFLRPGRGDRIVIEVSAHDGAAPRGSTIDHVRAVLADVSGKEVVVTAGRTPPADDSWTPAEVRAAVESVSASAQGGSAAVLRLMFVHGRWEDDERVLGVAVRGDAAVVFVDGTNEAATPLVGSGSIEVATTTHEVGHLLGLVDLYLDTGRADPEHPGHSSNRRSVMYWAVESTLVTELLTGGPPRDFDDDDRADLAAVRAGG